MARKQKPTTDAVKIIHRLYYKGRPKRLRMLQEVRFGADVARTIYGLRRLMHMSRSAFAKRAGVAPFVIEELEDNDYSGKNLLGILALIMGALAKKQRWLQQLTRRTRPAPRKSRGDIGLSVDFAVNSNRRNLNDKDADWLLDKFIELVESRKWYAGGGVHVVDLDKDPDEKK